MLDNPEEAQEIISEVINLDLDIVKATWDTHKMVLVLDENQILKDITAEGKWIRKTQENYKNKDVPNYKNYIDASFMRNLN